MRSRKFTSFPVNISDRIDAVTKVRQRYKRVRRVHGIHAPEFFSVTVYDKYIMKAAGTVYADPYDGEYAFCQKIFQRFSGDAVCALPYGCDVQDVFQRLPLDIAFIIIHMLFG